METPVEVKALVEKYHRDAEYYRSNAFKEMAIRTEFLNPILLALGWNPNNIGLSAANREVIQEDIVTIDGSGKAPDYAFVLDRKRMFFLEAKRPGVRIATDKAPAYQIRRYCWNAGLPIGLVTDFEEWAIYDCRSEPHPTDPPTTGRIDYFTYQHLEEKWDELAGLFGREAVAQGSLSRYSAEHRLPRGTLTVDQAFLQEISDWRRALAVDISKHNPTLNVVKLNNAVQTLIDRIIFLRIAEARGLEAFGELKSIADDKTSGLYDRLTALFRRADDRYNSGLFHFRDSKEQAGEPDTFSLQLKVSDQVLRDIIRKLYHPFPYEFSVMPADILGRVYEQFLGATITLEGHKAVVEEKPEVRKAGGVYYTPIPIVDYIVEETIGPLVKGATPGEVAKLKIVDTACGSGSFLIAAFQYLIDWHTAYYATGSRNEKKYLEKTPSGGVRLSTAERKRILLNNLFGVDIDPQAVEVTKLALLLKVIEGQTQMELAVGRILPDLRSNIRCGNSIIGLDFPLPLNLSEEERLVFNPFSWESEFPKVFQSGGFDAVVGNPPYLSIDGVWGKKDPRLAYLKRRYPDIHTDKTDILFYFLSKAVEICKGEVGLIVSRSFLEADKAQKLRGWLAKNTRIREVLDFREASVFPRVGINTAIIRLSGSRATKNAVFRQYKDKALPPGYTAHFLREEANFKTNKKPLTELGSAAWISTDAETASLLAKIDAAGTPVGDILHIGKGMETGHNKAFVIPRDNHGLLAAAQRHGLTVRRARNSDITPYGINATGPHLLYLEDANSFAGLPSEVRDHLHGFREELEGRAAFVRGDCLWWQFTWPLHKEFANEPRIFVPYRARNNRFAVDGRANFLGLTDTTVLYNNGQPESLHYIEAVLNSQVLTYRFRFIGKLVGGGTYEYFHNTVRKLPVPRLLPGHPVHDALVELARAIRDEKDVVRSTGVRSEQETAQKKIELHMDKIDGLVAELFGLTGDEHERIRHFLRG